MTELTDRAARDRMTTVGLRWATLWALLGSAVVLLWLYGTFSNRALRLCGPQLAGEKVVTLCQPATDDPIALGLVTLVALLPAIGQTSIVLLRRRG